MITDEKSVLALYVLHVNMKFCVYSSSKSLTYKSDVSVASQKTSHPPISKDTHKNFFNLGV